MTRHLLIISTLLLTVATASARKHIEIKPGEFSAIESRLPAEFIISNNPDSAGMVVTSADDDIADKLHFTVTDGVLTCDIDKGEYKDLYKLISQVSVYVPSPLSAVRINGSGNMNIKNNVAAARDVALSINGSGSMTADGVTTGSLLIGISGSGDINITGDNAVDTLGIEISGSGEVNVSSLNAVETSVSIMGSGNVTITGKSDFTGLKIAGSADINCRDLLSRLVNARIAGSGNIECHAVEMINATTSGSGTINVSGHPATAKMSGRKRNIKINE